MAQAVEQARKERELSKAALVADLDRLEAGLRAELDLKTRLRRDAPRILLIVGATVVLVGAVVVLRARLGGRNEIDLDEQTEDTVALAAIALELREIHKALNKQKGKGGGSFLQKALLRGVSAAGAAAGSVAARQMVGRQAPATAGTRETGGR